MKIFSLQIPTWATALASATATVLTVLNQTTFGFDAPWRSALTVALAFIAGLGISPLTKKAFQNLIHLPHGVSVAISSGMAAAALGLTQIDASQGVKGLIVGVLTFLAGLGFGPAANLPVVVAPHV
jgi:hypothetical protein